MCEKRLNDEVEGKRKRERKMSLLRRNRLLVLMLAIFAVTLFLGVPSVQETRIRIVVTRNIIEDVSVETENVPLIAKIWRPSYDVGAYTINVTIEETGETFSIYNVPSGEYIIIWEEGVPESGLYTIKVRLFTTKLEDEFVLHVSF